MAAFELLHQAHRHCSYKTQSHFSPLLPSHFHQFLSSSSSQSQPESPENPIPVQPVWYIPKDSPQSLPTDTTFQASTRPESNTQDPVNADGNTWTREDLRYLKEAPKITPVSYPTRVVPLPEDRVEEEGGVEAKGDEELERKRRRIEAQKRAAMRRVLNVEEEMVPFPTLVNVKSSDEKKKKVVYDLKEAIRLVKMAKYLRQLMLDTKKGTVTKDITKAVKEAKRGVPFKKIKAAIVYVGIGKVSFQDEALCENVGSFVHVFLRQKPGGLKKQCIGKRRWRMTGLLLPPTV
ncbi:uncharacterized protein LOC107782853 isoform X2 [Nicotiana tabacum]|uniref:Uncharacterized protein LOC107782853 isoform X2 n=4 Tax=Nicotiana TaxID=4085 RepID=A0AC58RLZ9_TOBAC|nr:PREDICTED: uncharacterized protein LOC104222977 isoform X2 [Nicotiana sylvestris]XP_016459277.1 PREDICTED: 50S ribosomal protein L1-like isoform X2 [Nicotiana tabacum]